MKTYAEIAENNLLWAKYGLDIGEKLGQYNTVVIEAQQSAEKFMKGFITDYVNINHQYDKDLSTHNLRKLALIINDFTPNKTLDPMKCKYLGDWYFDARYPGENYTEITDKEEAQRCIQIAEEIRDALYDAIKMLRSEPSFNDTSLPNSSSSVIKFGS